MKNSRISFTQFCFMSGISMFVSVLFIDSSASILQPLLCAAALGVNCLFVILYKGSGGRALTLAASAYVSVTAFLTSYIFVSYICDALGYGPCALIAVILFGFSFFCSVKGIEAAARASLIVGAVVLLSLVYIVVSTAAQIDFGFSLRPVFTPAALIMLFPSAVYILLYDNIIPDKKYNFYVISLFTSVYFAFFTTAASGKEVVFPVRVLPAEAQIDVFKGSDGLLLTVLTLSAMYINVLAALSVLKNRRHNYVANAVYLAVIAAACVLALACR